MLHADTVAVWKQSEVLCVLSFRISSPVLFCPLFIFRYINFDLSAIVYFVICFTVSLLRFMIALLK